MKKSNTKTLRDHLTRALETAEKAKQDGKKSFIDADTIPSITRDLKSAIMHLDRLEAGAPLTEEGYKREAENIIMALECPGTPDAFRYFLQEFMSRMTREYDIIKPSDRADDCMEFSPAAIRALYPLIRQMDGGGHGVVELINTAAWLMDGDTPDHLVGFIEKGSVSDED